MHTRTRGKNSMKNTEKKSLHTGGHGTGKSETRLDKGKMRALYNAGWTIEMIAFEMMMKKEEVDEALSYYDENGNWKNDDI